MQNIKSWTISLVNQLHEAHHVRLGNESGLNNFSGDYKYSRRHPSALCVCVCVVQHAPLLQRSVCDAFVCWFQGYWCVIVVTKLQAGGEMKLTICPLYSKLLSCAHTFPSWPPTQSAGENPSMSFIVGTQLYTISYQTGRETFVPDVYCKKKRSFLSFLIQWTRIHY